MPKAQARKPSAVAKPAKPARKQPRQANSSTAVVVKKKPPPAPKFPYHLPYATLDLRKTPNLYRIGRGEEGVLSVQPYKAELLPHWRFRTAAIAKESSQALLAKFNAYLDENDFVGADMARKFVQMGVTRARRYANHKGGKKYQVSADGTEKIELPRAEVEDAEKAEAARVFGAVLEVIKANEKYKQLEERHRELYDAQEIPKMEGDEVDVKAAQIANGPKKVSLAGAGE
ncbi:hypothetical protein HDU87_002908 [Geranomyces variabilis]|uniref:DUF4385 domain-containing protein n=1 Tax=Geranomyces variabilis TaxID=109894 RepID=A0AAD5TKH6_9FUNG|nr:hypothetical protein HDU87_002908 [Geranomyces variabilis]